MIAIDDTIKVGRSLLIRTSLAAGPAPPLDTSSESTTVLSQWPRRQTPCSCAWAKAARSGQSDDRHRRGRPQRGVRLVVICRAGG